MNIHPNVLLWIINFLSLHLGKPLAGCPSLKVSQGSGIGPYIYLLYASDLQTLSPRNAIVKYADITLLVGQHSSVDISHEYENMCSCVVAVAVGRLAFGSTVDFTVVWMVSQYRACQVASPSWTYRQTGNLPVWLSTTRDPGAHACLSLTRAVLLLAEHSSCVFFLLFC